MDESNLVARTLALVGRRAGVTVHKIIPPGGGLGGGRDAAAMLRWAGGVSNLRALTSGEHAVVLPDGRARVGRGGGRVAQRPWSTSVGPSRSPFSSFGVNTGSCYQAFDELARSGEKPSGRNHLEMAARLVEPRLGETMDWLSAPLGNRVHLAGSGSTLFVEGHLESDVATWDVMGPEGLVQFCQTFTTPREA